MTGERWQETKALFGEARELDESEREELLRRRELDDPVLVAEVRRLLASEALTTDFLEPPDKARIEEPLRLLSFDFRGLRLGEFELEKEIGRGASGVVYLGLQPSLDRRVAIKILAPQLASTPRARERFQREAQAASRLRHPAIVTVLAFGEQQGALYLVMEHVRGKTLHQHLEGLRVAREQRTALPESAVDVSRPELAAKIVLRIAEGLEYCHRQGIVHRDIKPHNILLGRDLAPRIVDFGLAKDQRSAGITDAGLVAGTLHYMSPEQVQARTGDLDARTDIYSLGVVFYEMLTLRLPFEGVAPARLMHKVLHQRPTPPHHVASGVPRALSAICLRALEKAPGDRYESAAELAQDLQSFLRGSRVAIGARLRFEDAYRYVFVKRPWIAVTSVFAALLLVLALSGKGEVEAGKGEAAAVTDSIEVVPYLAPRSHSLGALLDQAQSPEEEALMLSEYAAIKKNLRLIKAKTSSPEERNKDKDK